MSGVTILFFPLMSIFDLQVERLKLAQRALVTSAVSVLVPARVGGCFQSRGDGVNSPRNMVNLPQEAHDDRWGLDSTVMAPQGIYTSGQESVHCTPEANTMCMPAVPY